MKRFELEVEHHYKNKFVGKHRIAPVRNLVTMGRSLDADIRLMGDEVSPVHAILEFDTDNWSLIDAGSDSGTWVAKKPVASAEIEDELVATIGGHQLKIKRHEIDRPLFVTDDVATAGSGTSSFHQIVIKRGELLVQTKLLPASESFTGWVGGKQVTFAPPKPGAWVTESIGDFTVDRRICKASEMTLTMSDRVKLLSTPEMRGPVVFAVSILVLFAALIVLAPMSPKEEVQAPVQNQYTRMIFDAKTLKKKRDEAKQLVAKANKQVGRKDGGGGPGNNPNTTPVASKSGTPKVVANMKLQGLSALLGKISKRAAQNAVKIQGTGLTPDSGAASGRALAAVGSLSNIGNGLGNGGSTFKVGGVGTLGKGGGTGGALGAIGSLATGGAGNASVGIIDEETEIDGGLDKDVIARVIQNQLGEIRYCYERQLSAEPDIYGKVMVKFTIDAQGAVNEQRVGLTTLRSASVEGCILRRMARWKFPKPKGGTQVLVSYPFLFKATN